MDFRRHLVRFGCALPTLLFSGIGEGANSPCVDNTTIAQAAFSTISVKHYYMECSVIADGYHPFLVRLTVDRRAAVTARLKDPAAQTLACTAHPRDSARTGLPKKEMVVLASCRPARVGDVWTLP